MPLTSLQSSSWHLALPLDEDGFYIPLFPGYSLAVNKGPSEAFLCGCPQKPSLQSQTPRPTLCCFLLVSLFSVTLPPSCEGCVHMCAHACTHSLFLFPDSLTLRHPSYCHSHQAVLALKGSYLRSLSLHLTFKGEPPKGTA